MQRLQKIIADAGVCSRRNAEELIRDGRVKLNGKLAEIGNSAEETDPNLVITVDGRPIGRKEREYYAFHKPLRVETTMTLLPGRRTVGDFVVRFKPGMRLYSVGRLDYHTSGLLLITNDGEFANKVMHPRYETEKFYEGKVERPLTDKDVALIEGGVELSDGKTWPAKIRVTTPANRGFQIQIHEGRNRIIRRMFKEIDNKVMELKRTKIGPVKLGDLKPGKFRTLTAAEVKALTGVTAVNSGKTHSGGSRPPRVSGARNFKPKPKP